MKSSLDTRIEIRPGRNLNITFYKNPNAAGTIFFIHGLGGRSAQWRKQIPWLQQKYSLIIPDLYGLGESDKPRPWLTNPYDFANLSDDIQALFDRFATKENILMGHSYGGALTISLALNRQDKINKLILFNPTPCSPITITPLFRLPAFILELLRPQLEKAFLQGGYAAASDPTMIAEEMKAGKANRMYVIKAMAKGMQDIPRIDLSKLLIPTLIIYSDHDGIIPAEKIKSCYQLLPHHQFENIPNAAHMTLLEQPELVNNIIAKFLQISA